MALKGEVLVKATVLRTEFALGYIVGPITEKDTLAISSVSCYGVKYPKE